MSSIGFFATLYEDLIPAFPTKNPFLRLERHLGPTTGGNLAFRPAVPGRWGAVEPKTPDESW